VENKDHATNMDGEWVETRMRKMIYGIVAPRVEHPTMAEKASVKLYSKSDRVCFAIITKSKNILLVASFSELFEGRGNIASIKRPYH
jgi:hypothetical protein